MRLSLYMILEKKHPPETADCCISDSYTLYAVSKTAGSVSCIFDSYTL